MLEPNAYPSTEDDPILAELRRVRAEQFAEHGRDIRRLVADTRRLQFLQGNDVVSRSKCGRLEVVFKGAGTLSGNRHEAPTLQADAADGPGRQRG